MKGIAAKEIKKGSYRKTVLENGIRVVAERMPSVRSISLGIWVNVGSRDENDQEMGISHFLEHMLFKGTRRRTAHDISLEMDSIGGELNAFTTREGTTFYAKMLDEHLRKGVDIISDIFLHSRLERRDIEREKQVVLEELKMVEDDPEDYIHDLHAKAVWDGNPLARSILGTHRSVSSLRRETIQKYVAKHYSPENIVISVAGQFRFQELLDLLNRSIGQWKRSGEKGNRVPPLLRPGVFVRKKKVEQVHLCFGAMGLPQGHKDRFVIYALNGLLGSSMGSRLFQEIREKRGLVYTIYSYLSSYEDTGLFNIYAATGPKTVRQVIDLIHKEIRKVKRNGITRQELSRVKNQMKGSLMLSLESTSSRMSRLARDEIYEGNYCSLQETLRRIEKVTVDQIHSLAQDIFQDRFLSLALLGPVARKDVPEGFPG
jgi:predicted Zn-dependent peptidase